MGKVRFTTEQIIRKLREAEVLHSQGATISIICKRLEIHEQTYYKWRKEYGSIRVDQAKRTKCEILSHPSVYLQVKRERWVLDRLRNDD